uniref:RNA-directed DNA polymerase n=1 Tax=Nicotiana sylvestris TaxID=4096 RepID=A0A1U7W8I6_NICSY|nr:PREDICTED: uncharacterized protein LOC104221594 [Nicotiana sylvestris]
MDPGSTFSYVTPYFALDFGIETEQLFEPFSVSTPVGDPVIASHIYRGYVIIIQDRETTIDLIELEMVNFDVIMGMDWLYKCYVLLDCRAKVVKFEFPNEPVHEWKGNITEPQGKFISYLKAKKMITKGCLYHLVRVIDTTAEVTNIQFVPVVNEFPDEFPGIPPDRIIDFGIDVVPNTQPISILPYRMAPAKLRELKEQLKDLLDKGFIRPSVSPWVSRESIKVDPQKIEAVKSWPRPTTPTEIRSFLGLTGYYRWFVEGFSTLASPITKLTQKAAKFQWSDACERSFQELKARLTTTPVLTLPTGMGDFVLNIHEKNYPTHDLELAAVVFALKIWRHYLYAEHCEVYTDHKSLQYIFKHRELNLRQRRWLELLKDYDLSICYHPGKANVVADALSQKSGGTLAHLPISKELVACAIARSSLIERVKAKQFEDLNLVNIRNSVKSKEILAFSLDEDEGVEDERLLNIDIPLWKWKMINMDFVVGLPRTRLKHDSIWVIVDRLMKSTHFLPVKMTDTAPQYAKLYLKEIVRLHGIPTSIISDRRAQFTAHFWQSFQERLGTSVNLSAAFHPQTDGQAERTIQTLEDMLRACVLNFGGN